MSDGRNMVAELEARLDETHITSNHRAVVIEKLRAYADEMEDKLVTALIKQQELKSRIDWLHIENRLLKEGKIGDTSQMIEDLQLDNERLRSALTRSATACMDHDCCVAHAIARRALEGKDE